MDNEINIQILKSVGYWIGGIAGNYQFTVLTTPEKEQCNLFGGHIIKLGLWDMHDHIVIKYGKGKWLIIPSDEIKPTIKAIYEYVEKLKGEGVEKGA